MMDPLLQRVQQTIRDYHMLDCGQRVLIAVSGGPDSMTLLHALWRLRHLLALELYVAHLNHQMRAMALEDQRFVASVARDLGLTCICATADIPLYQRQHKLSAEDAGRQVRYAFLRSTALQLKAQRIALGHTANDQAETVLFHLLRGSGLRGLSGMPPVRTPLIRPLIDLSRHEILHYLQSHGVPFREDVSNQQRCYTRNRIRLDLLPVLEQHYNPRLVQTLCTSAHLLADDEAVLQTLAHRQFWALRRPAACGGVALAIAPLVSLPPALQRRVLREALAEVMGDLQGVLHPHIAAILTLLQETSGHKQLHLPRGVVVERDYDILFLHHAVGRTAVEVDVPLPIPGRCCLAALRVTIVSERLSREEATGPFPSGEATWLDAERVGEAVRIRTRRSGDRVQPLGSPYEKKLKSFLIDAKIPRLQRDRLPLVVGSAGIAWVAGVRPAEWAKVTAATRVILHLRMLRHNPAVPVDIAVEPL